MVNDPTLNYSKTLGFAESFKRGDLTFSQLLEKVKALPPHLLGCAYVMAPVPAPPPGIEFDPRRMPNDWVGTWGEVAMTYWAGCLTLDEYETLHRAAHRERSGFPECR